MTPKEKANILINQFYNLTASFDNSQAKQCALICVDIARSVTRFYDYKKKIGEEIYFNDECFWTYWEEVKQEIEKL